MKNKDSVVLTEQDLLILELKEQLSLKDLTIFNMTEKINKLNKDKEDLIFENEQNAVLIFEMQKKLNELLKSNENLSEKYLVERTRRFIKPSEKLEDIIINETEEVIKLENANKKKAGRKKGGKNFASIDFSKSFTEVLYEDPILESGLSFDQLVLANSKERYVIEVIPSSIKVIKIIKRSYKHPISGKFYYPLSNDVFPGAVLTPSFAAYLAYHKYELGIPFHHLERHFKKTLDVSISKQLMSSWMKKTADKLNPLYNQLKEDLLNNSAKVIHSDETTLSISKKPVEDTDRKNSYVYLYSTSYYDKQINIYDFHESRKIDKTAKWLKDYNGYMIVDDYAGYNKLVKDNSNIKLQKCFAHVRRRFADILKNVPANEKKDTVSYKILSLINQLFAFEASYKEKRLTPTLIKSRREFDQRPIIKDLEVLLFENTYKSGSLIEKAVNYAKSNWNELLTYFEYGYLEITNNLAERAIKPFVINRKVFMTSGSYAGARYTTVLFSLIRTALINNLDPENYLCYVLTNIDKVKVDELTPYSNKLPNDLKVIIPTKSDME